MEMQATETTQASTGSTPSTGTTSTPTATESSSTQPGQIQEATQSTTVQSSEAAPQYQPNYKYKALDQEFEIDEEYRGYIKSADDEKRIKRLFEQFKGVDKIKEWHASEKKNAVTYKTQLDTYNQKLQQVNQLVEKGNPWGALESLGFKPEHIYKAAKQLLDFDDLPQQAKEVHARSKEQERYAQEVYQQNLEIQQQLYEVRVQAKTVELDQTLARQDIKGFADQYDAVNGPGSFRRRTIETAQALHLRSQAQGNPQDISAMQAAEAVIRDLKPFMANSQQVATSPKPKEVPVIPASGSNSRGSPSGGPQIRSVADIEKAYEAKMAGRR